jgi:ATP:cob(I)alamin adenosyltransferase
MSETETSKDNASRLRACGFLIYRTAPRHSFLLMRHDDRWDLPKGHSEPGESDLEAALRELYEETGIAPADIEIDEGFRFRITYTVRSPRTGDLPREKDVIIFLARLAAPVDPVVTEHPGFQWFDWNPPHRIQEQTIDPLLQAVERHWESQAAPGRPPRNASMKIYTRFGDQGETRLLAGMTTRKTDVRVAFCGELDELNALTGLVIACDPESALVERLKTVQRDLLTVGAWAAAVGGPESGSRHRLTLPRADAVESWIDELDEGLPPLRRFILPGGHWPAALLHLTRAVCRRGERSLVALFDQFPGAEGSEQVLAWLNRLGDWLFVAARWANMSADTPETEWISGESNEPAPRE